MVSRSRGPSSTWRNAPSKTESTSASSSGASSRNVPLLALSVAAEEGILIDFTEKTPIKRLYVARRGDGERLLFAEGDLPVEEASLETLIATIRSSRWQAGHEGSHGKKKKQAHEAPKNPSAIICSNCGASIAPAASTTVTCVFCNHAVPIPDDVRERVAAAQNLARARSSGFSRLTRLLESQPSATHALTAIVIAGIPIALAWPVAGFLACGASRSPRSASSTCSSSWCFRS